MTGGRSDTTRIREREKKRFNVKNRTFPKRDEEKTFYSKDPQITRFEELDMARSNAGMKEKKEIPIIIEVAVSSGKSVYSNNSERVDDNLI